MAFYDVKQLMKNIARVSAVFLVVLTSFAGCSSDPSANAPALGKAYFSFEPTQVEQLELTRSLPGETAWSVRLKRAPGSPWTIESYPSPILDRTAHLTFVDHLISTIKTLMPVENLSDQRLDAFGLQPPRVKLKWRAASPGASGEVLFGNPKHNGQWLGQLEPTAPAQVLAGALIRMIETLADPMGLREPKILTRTLDDFDQIEILEKSNRKSQLERVGTEWERITGKKHSPAPNAKELLEKLAHFRVLAFVDDEQAQKRIEQAAQSATIREFRFLGRGNQKVAIQFFEFEKRVFGRSDNRSPYWYETYPEVTEAWKSLAGR